MNVYKTLPVPESKNYILREVRERDADDLLKVYSDEKAVPHFNGDNCHGDDFHYTAMERMKQAISFWLFSYENGYFVRWAVVEKSSGKAVGTIELFHRDSDKDYFDNCGLLRLDLISDCERVEVIEEIVSLLKDSAFDWFYCDKIATKVNPFADERKTAVEALGFKLCEEPLVGDGGEKYFDYYVLKK
ncbi:MAG: GNAT family N-acetyltransferase [Clostridia bacterium]|nr:GNAT family N-acetyltransferase [Clostridia bacterium]